MFILSYFVDVREVWDPNPSNVPNMCALSI
jgi:hypothetical protein